MRCGGVGEGILIWGIGSERWEKSDAAEILRWMTGMAA